MGKPLADQPRDDIRECPEISGPSIGSSRFLRSSETLHRKKARKSVGRHRVGVAASLVALVALLAGTLATSIGLLRAHEAERRAEQEAATASAINGFLVEMLSSANPQQGSRDIRTSDGLNSAAEGPDERFADQPSIHAELLRTIGITWLQLGENERAVGLLERAAEEEERLPPSSAHLETLIQLGEAYGSVGRLDGSAAIAKSGLERTKNGNRQESLHRATALNNRAVGYFHLGRGDEGLDLLEEAIQIRTRLLGKDHR